MKRNRRVKIVEADLDITAFMNLMIVLVPVLLLGMVFSQITVVPVNLPDAAIAEEQSGKENHQIELLIRKNRLEINYPQGVLLKSIPSLDTGDYDFKLLSLTLQEVKRILREKSIDKKSILILSEADTSYQTIVSAMDAVRSYQAVVAASVVEAELFPVISFGDASREPSTSNNNSGAGD